MWAKRLKWLPLISHFPFILVINESCNAEGSILHHNFATWHLFVNHVFYFAPTTLIHINLFHKIRITSFEFILPFPVSINLASNYYRSINLTKPINSSIVQHFKSKSGLTSSRFNTRYSLLSTGSNYKDILSSSFTLKIMLSQIKFISLVEPKHIWWCTLTHLGY